MGVCRSDELRSSRPVWDAVLNGPARPAAKSSLAADDAVFPSLPCSSLAWTGIRSAATAFDTALELLGDPGEPFDTEVLDHLRDALVHASHAITVLAPARARRVDHALRMAWTAYSGADGHSASLATYAPFPVPLVVREAESLLRSRTFAATPRWTDTSSVRVAANLMMQRVADPELFEATARFLWESTPEELHLAVRDDAVTCAESVFATITHAISLWQRRSRPAPSVAEAIEASTAPQRSLFTRTQTPVDAFNTQAQGRRRLALR